MSRLIDVDMIEDGMELAESIRNKFGQIMLAENVRLESKHKKMLKIWGITSVSVSGDESQEEVKYDDASFAKAKTLVQEIIPWKPVNQYEEEIYQLCLERVLETQIQ